jgi:transposase
MSKFIPLGSCQRQLSKKVESSAPVVIPRGFLNQLGFAMWTPTTRQQHSRIVTRYQTDLTDAEWRVIAPHPPKPYAMGRPREWPMREIVNGIFYVMRAGCPWRLLPNDLPPWATIYRWFAAWRDDGRFERINHALVMAIANGSGATPVPRRRSSTAKAKRPPSPAVRAVTMRARRSTGTSAMRWLTPTAAASSSNCEILTGSNEHAKPRRRRAKRHEFGSDWRTTEIRRWRSRL